MARPPQTPIRQENMDVIEEIDWPLGIDTLTAKVNYTLEIGLPHVKRIFETTEEEITDEPT